MIPGKIFTSFAKFQRIISVNDFWIPICLQELLQAPLGFLRSFCFGRIRLDPLGGQILHHDCTMIVSRFTTFTKNLEICCYQVAKIFCTKYGSAITPSARGPCNFGPLTDLAISVLREMSINTVLTQSSLLVDVGSKDTSWEELAWESLSVFKNSVIHQIFSEFLGFRWVWVFAGLAANNGSLRSITSSTFGLDTSTGWESIPLRSSLSRVSLSLDTVVVGEIDELKEDVGRLLSCLESVT